MLLLSLADGAAIVTIVNGAETDVVGAAVAVAAAAIPPPFCIAAVAAVAVGTVTADVADVGDVMLHITIDMLVGVWSSLLAEWVNGNVDGR